MKTEFPTTLNHSLSSSFEKGFPHAFDQLAASGFLSHEFLKAAASTDGETERAVGSAAGARRAASV